MERKFLDFSLPGSECSTERKFHGSESSLYGLFARGNESAEERKGQLPEVVNKDTDKEAQVPASVFIIADC